MTEKELREKLENIRDKKAEDWVNENFYFETYDEYERGDSYSNFQEGFASCSELLVKALMALEFYADENNYNHHPATSDPNCMHFVGFVIEAEPGGTARQALQEITKEIHNGNS